LERLHELMRQGQWANDEESQTFLREAEALIAGASEQGAESVGDTQP
jgi:hypothetical protein